MAWKNKKRIDRPKRSRLSQGEITRARGNMTEVHVDTSSVHVNTGMREPRWVKCASRGRRSARAEEAKRTMMTCASVNRRKMRLHSCVRESCSQLNTVNNTDMLLFVHVAAGSSDKVACQKNSHRHLDNDDYFSIFIFASMPL